MIDAESEEDKGGRGAITLDCKGIRVSTHFRFGRRDLRGEWEASYWTSWNRETEGKTPLGSTVEPLSHWP